MTQYSCTVLLDASTGYTVEADSPEAAAEAAEDRWGEEGTGLCHQCAAEVDMSDCYGVIVHDAEGTKELLDTRGVARQLAQRDDTVRALVEIIDRELMPHIARLPVQRLDVLNETLIAARKLLEGGQ